MNDPYEIFDEIESDIAIASQQMADQIASDVKDRIGVPVGYAVGPRGGTRVIRSKPGEPPRKETGNLQSGVIAEVVAVRGQISGSIYDEVPYAAPLESDLDRPILTDLAETYEDFLADGVTRAAAGET